MMSVATLTCNAALCAYPFRISVSAFLLICPPTITANYSAAEIFRCAFLTVSVSQHILLKHLADSLKNSLINNRLMRIFNIIFINFTSVRNVPKR